MEAVGVKHVCEQKGRGKYECVLQGLCASVRHQDSRGGSRSEAGAALSGFEVSGKRFQLKMGLPTGDTWVRLQS